jgi:hypothetical protein
MAMSVLAGCHGQPDRQSQVPTSTKAPSQVPHADDWAKLILGDWVSRPRPAKERLTDVCSTDYTFTISAGGGFSNGTDDGHWQLRGNALTITMSGNEQDDDDGPAKSGASKPYVVHTRLVRFASPVLTTMTDGKPEYWYHCPASQQETRK